MVGQSLDSRNTQYKISFGRKIWDWKIHSPSSLDDKTREYWGKTPHYLSFTWEFWAPFSRVWLTMGQRATVVSPKTSLYWEYSLSCCRHSIGRPESPLIQEGILKTLPCSPHHRALRVLEERHSYIPNKCVHHKQPSSGPVPTLKATIQREGELVLINLWKNPPEIFQLQSW